MPVGKQHYRVATHRDQWMFVSTVLHDWLDAAEIEANKLAHLNPNEVYAVVDIVSNSIVFRPESRPSDQPLSVRPV